MYNLSKEEDYDVLLEDVREIMEPVVPFILGQNKSIQVGGGKGYVYASYAFFTTVPNLLIVIKDTENDVLRYYQYSNQKLVVGNIQDIIIELSLKLFNLEDEELIWLIKGICKSVKETLQEFNEPLKKEATITVEDEEEVVFNLVFDPYSKLDSELFIKEKLHKIRKMLDNERG